MANTSCISLMLLTNTPLARFQTLPFASVPHLFSRSPAWRVTPHGYPLYLLCFLPFTSLKPKSNIKTNPCKTVFSKTSCWVLEPPAEMFCCSHRALTSVSHSCRQGWVRVCTLGWTRVNKETPGVVMEPGGGASTEASLSTKLHPFTSEMLKGLKCKLHFMLFGNRIPEIWQCINSMWYPA